MKLLKILGIIIAMLVALFLIVAALAPRALHVQRKLVINAPADTIFNQLNGFKKWEAWSPWLEKDPTIKNTYSGPDEGVGSKVAWTSKQSGDGSMEIVEANSPAVLSTKLILNDFPPFENRITLQPVEGGTEVTWTDTGTLSYPWNIMTLAADQLMGKDYDKALANLKKKVEGLPK